MSVQLAHNMMLETEECCNCGMVFAMPASIRRRLLESGDSFYCPKGHSQHYSESEVKKLRKMLEQANKRNTDLVDELGKERQKARKATKEAGRLKTRAKAGVCPCCQRTFKQLAEHMAEKHPDFKAGEKHAWPKPRKAK